MFGATLIWRDLNGAPLDGALTALGGPLRRFCMVVFVGYVLIRVQVAQGARFDPRSLEVGVQVILPEPDIEGLWGPIV